MILRRCKFIALLGLSVAVPTLAAGTPNERRIFAVEAKRFVIHYTPGKAWVKGKTLFQQPLRPHANYMKRLHARQVLLMGGPYLDNSGGIAIILAANQKEAERVMNSDPAIKSGVLKGVVRPWHVALEQ